MKKMLKKKSKGFTLVELLIVIIIIGILAGMMMLSTGGATAKAEATKIVSDMRNMKAAAIMYYADNSKWTETIGDLSKYLDGKVEAISDESQIIGKATFQIVSADPKLDIQATVTEKDIQDALKMMGDAVTSSSETIYKMSIK